MLTFDDTIMMIDTETTNDIDCPIVYDVGYQIFKLDGTLFCERSFVNADVFLDKELMASAYFIDKVPAYWEAIKAGSRELKTWRNIKKQIAEDCKRFGVTVACAHNAMFDNRALNTTQRYLTTSKYRYFLPYGIEWHDTLKMARAILKNDDAYGAFCYENNYLTSRGCRRYTAEIIYRFITGCNDFEESHTGLEDVKIEKEILHYCLSKDAEVNGKLWED
jgi:hypothetical protein